jgi:predicted ChrR family anti-sigma factor
MDVQPATMKPEAFAQAMGDIDTQVAGLAGGICEPETVGDVPLPLATGRAGLGPRRWAAPGLWAAPIKTLPTDGWRGFLLRAPANTAIPHHGHVGAELIAVLMGAFEDDRRVVAGDFVETCAGVRHSLRVTKDGPCACLIAWRGPVLWRGWSRLLTPLLGI